MRAGNRVSANFKQKMSLTAQKVRSPAYEIFPKVIARDLRCLNQSSIELHTATGSFLGDRGARRNQQLLYRLWSSADLPHFSHATQMLAASDMLDPGHTSSLQHTSPFPPPDDPRTQWASRWPSQIHTASGNRLLPCSSKPACWQALQLQETPGSQWGGESSASQLLGGHLLHPIEH